MSENFLSSTQDCRSLLRFWREESQRRSEEVVEIWESMLSEDAHLSALGDERWMIVEQVAVAAMDVHRVDVLDHCLKQLRAEFDTDSFRVRRLYAMRCEMTEDYENALEFYDSILADDDANSQARKRKIAIHKAQKDNAKAIQELNRYLKDFMSDAESWMELCDLYISEQDYAKAAFCCEELILSNPNNHIYFQRYAEIRYTQGGFENMELAKTYYSKTVTLNPENMRALYGLLLTSSQLASSPKCTAQKKREHVKTVAWTVKQIASRYGAKKNNTVPTSLLDGLIGQHQLS